MDNLDPNNDMAMLVLDNPKRYTYASKEGVEDCMLWAGYSQEEVDEKLKNYVPLYWDRIEKKYISVEEYSKRMLKNENNRGN